MVRLMRALPWVLAAALLAVLVAVLLTVNSCADMVVTL